ncbi:hypothetical protein [Pyruvatibacter mobilis]|uniref:tellurite resistance TerB family protein n=1 Tax=Pyruvatibacter mobilis TaxID=1712261 RepID=UPI003C7CB508
MEILTDFLARFRKVQPPEFSEFEPRVGPGEEVSTSLPEAAIPEFLPGDSPTRKGPRLVTSAFRGVTAAIEYCDESEETTFRRVSFGDLVEWSNGSQTIYAYCFERQAPRSFRIDRIQCFFDQDGVVAEVDDFFAAFAKAAEARIEDMLLEGQYILVLKELALEELVILVALARCDGYTPPEEIEVLVQHFVYALEGTGVICDDVAVEGVKQSIARFSPPPWEVERAIRRLGRLPDDRLRAFRRSVRSLVEADGAISDREHALIDELCRRGAM